MMGNSFQPSGVADTNASFLKLQLLSENVLRTSTANFGKSLHEPEIY